MFNKNLINVKAVYEKYNRLLVDPKTMNVACLCDREVVKLEGEFADYEGKRKENVLQLRRARRIKRKIKTRNKKSRMPEIEARPRTQVLG